MDYNFYTLYICSIAYLLSVFLSMSKIPFADKYNIEYLIAIVGQYTKKLFLKVLKNRVSWLYILTNVATIVAFFLITFILFNILKIFNVVVLVILEAIFLYSLIGLRIASDKIVKVYYSLLKYEEEEIKEELEELLNDPDMHGVRINIDSHDKDDVIALTTEIMAKYILSKGNIIITSFILGPAFAIAHKTMSVLFGNPDNKCYMIYRIVTIVATYINSATLFLTLIILKLDYKNAFQVFLESRNKKTAFGYNETLSIIAGGLDISIGTPPAVEVDETESHIDEIMGGGVEPDDEFALQNRLIGESQKYLEVNDIKSSIDIYYTNSVILFGLAMVFRFIVYAIMFY